MKFTYDENNPTRGIIYWIWMHKKSSFSNFVQVCATSQSHDFHDPTNAVDFNNNNYWTSSGNFSEEYLHIYFPYYTIKITSYLIMTTPYYSGEHPKKWAFAISQDNGTFLHKEEIFDDGTMNGKLHFRNIPYDHGMGCSFRLYPINNYADSVKRMDVNQIELFGELFFTNSFTPTSCQWTKILYSFLIVLYLI